MTGDDRQPEEREQRGPGEVGDHDDRLPAEPVGDRAGEQAEQQPRKSLQQGREGDQLRAPGLRGDQQRARGEEELKTPDFMRMVKEAGAQLNVDSEMLKRPLNVGFSGGEKKRAEIMQMALLKPSLAVLDETDSGLDIDALQVVSKGVNALRDGQRSMLVITHYQRLLNHIVPDVVHVFADGRIVESGDKDLALKLEAEGYASYGGEAA